jgi:PAS domain S-box-containing protein
MSTNDLFNLMPEPLHYEDANGTILDVNGAWLEAFGYSRVEVVGLPASKLFTASTGKSTTGVEIELPASLIPGEEEGERFTVSCRDGAHKPVLRRTIPEGGRRLVVLRDLAAEIHRSRLTAQQERLASVGMLAAGVAHEINNPIGFISSMLNTIERYTKRIGETLHGYRALDRVESVEELGEQLDKLDGQWQAQNIEFALSSIPDLLTRCKEGASRVKHIVDDLRSFARNDEDIEALININDVIESSLNIGWNEIKYKAEVKKELSATPDIQGNKGRLVSVFVNLFVNAAQAIPEKGTLTIRTEASSRWVKATVTDTGCGISPEHKAKIFDPFFTTKPVGVGTGLGLNLVYNIIQQHDGEITVDSEVGKGTTFTVKLPLRNPGTQSAPDSMAPPASERFR